MVAVLLVTHGDLAQALLSSAALIMGEAALIESHGLYHGDSVDNLKDTIKEAINRLSECSQGDGVLILTDLFGGSPSNAAARAMHELQDSVHCEYSGSEKSVSVISRLLKGDKLCRFQLFRPF